MNKKGKSNKQNEQLNNNIMAFFFFSILFLLFLYGCTSSQINKENQEVKNLSSLNTGENIGNEINETTSDNSSINQDFDLPSMKEPLPNFNNFFIEDVKAIDGFFYYNCDNLNEEQLSKYNACLESDNIFVCAKECNKEFIRPEQGNIFYAISYGFVITKQEAVDKGISCDEQDGKCLVKTLSAMPFNALQTFFNLIAGTKTTYKYYLEDENGNLYAPDYRTKFGYVFSENESLKPFVFSIPNGKHIKYFVIKEYRRDFGIAKREVLIAKIKIS